MEIRGQNICAISFVSDSHGEGANYLNEFLFNVWGCFDNQEEADQWVRTVAADHVTEHTINLIDLYEWCTPLHQSLVTPACTHHRNIELDKIMKTAHQNQLQKGNFEKWCKQNETDVPTIDIL